MGKHRYTRQVIARLARVEGHVRAVKNMVAAGTPCADVLLQMAAVRSALDRAAKLLLADHLEHCLADASRGRRAARSLSDFRKALERFIT